MPGAPDGVEFIEQHRARLPGLGQPVLEQREQLLLQAADLFQTVAVGVGVVIQGRHAIGADLHFQRQVFHGAGAEIQHARRAIAISQRAIERHDIDQRPEQALLATDAPQVATQRLVTVVLMLAAAATQLADGRGAVDQVGVVGQVQAQRRDVHLHAGHVEGCRTDAVHHHQPERLRTATGDLPQLGAQAGEQQVGPADAITFGDTVQCLPQGCGKCRAVADETGGYRRMAFAEADRLGHPRELFQPVGASRRGSPLGLPFLFFRQYRIVSAEATGRGDLPGYRGAVEFGDALVQQVGAVAVQGDVMHAAVKEILFRALQQRETARQLLLEVHRQPDIAHGPVTDPGFGLDPFGDAHLPNFERQVAAGEEHRLLVGDEHPRQRLAFGHRPLHRADQFGAAYLAGEGDAFGGVEHGPIFVEQVAGPEPLLGDTERLHRAPPCSPMSAHQPFSVGVFARSVKLSSSPCSRHSLSRVMIWMESRP